MEHIDYVVNHLTRSVEVKKKIISDHQLVSQISRVADAIVSAYRNKSKLLIAGNGGSAADSQHIAAEFVSRFYYDRPGIPAIALTTDTSMLTAIGNDYGFDKLFARQVQAQAKQGDVFIGISTSGNSENVIHAINEANSLGVTTVALCGRAGKMKDIADFAICVPEDSTPFIQEAHISIGHIICGIVEESLFPREDYV